MKKLFTSLKFLLVAVCLLGGGSSAWAESTITLYSQNFESFAADAAFNTVPGYWEKSSATVEKIAVDGSGNKYLTYQSSSGSTRNAAINFNISKYTAGDNWAVSFDAALKAGNKDGGMFLGIVGEKGAATADNAWSPSTGNLFSLTASTASSTSCTVSLGAYTLDDPIELASETYYHYELNWDGSNINLTITKNGEVTPALSTSKAYSSSDNTTYGNPKAIFWVTPRYYGSTNIDNILVTEDVDNEMVSDPSIAVAYAGANRTVTITPGVSSESNAVTTYYTLDGTDPSSSSSVYSAPLDIDADCTVKAITISSTDVASSIVSQDVTVGTLKLATPTLAKTGYSNGTYTVTMTSNQAGLAYSPASATLYYSIDGGAATEYSSPIIVDAGSSVTAYVSATNYTNSDEAYLATAERPALIAEWSIDFAGQATEDKGGVTVGAEAFTANGTSFGNISGAFTSNDNFGVKTGSSWLLRSTGSKGLYSFNGSGTPVGVSDLKEGQYVKIVVAGMTNCTVSGAASLVDNMSTTTELYIVANEDGNACIDFNRYVYIQSISVCYVMTSIAADLGTNGYATFACDYALDLTKANMPAGVTAYKAAVDGNTVRFTELDQTVPAYTGILLEGAASAHVFIPVVPSGDVVTDNAFEVNTAGTYFTPEAGYTYYGLLKNTLTFRPFDPLTVVIPAYKAYLKVADSSVHEFNVAFGDDATAISAIEKAQTTDNAIFDLSGRRVAKAQKGIYIVNGKKVVK